jgi:hypothetical protein
MRLVIHGAPRTKKTSNRVMKFGGRLKVVPSEAWCAWRDIAVQQIAGRRAPAGPLNCTALFYRAARVGDATGFYQGLADVLQEAGVVTDDKHIVAWDGSRLLADSRNPRVELTLTPLEQP